jgi:putative NADH-flavin reductase
MIIQTQGGGNSGKFITEALLKTGKHAVTAITRADSKSELPEGAISKAVDYEKPETIVEALKGQEALVITLNAFALSNEVKLIEAAEKAGVQYQMSGLHIQELMSISKICSITQ